MNYQETLRVLYSRNLHAGIKLGLGNMQQLDAAFDHPSQKLRAIHIAGSNGKGTLAHILAASLQKEGYKVGLYSSPHISCFRERIQINGELISERSLAALAEPILASNPQATFFEVTTMIAFCYFANKKVDYAIIETGLGGRLDATNILTPILSIITSISLEHTEILGKSLPEIAREKAGIVKPGVPALIGSSELLPFCHEETKLLPQDSLAKAALDSLNVKSFVPDRPPCRMEEIGNCTVDIAHNPSSLSYVSSLMRTRHGNNFAVCCNFSLQKNAKECLAAIDAPEIYFFPSKHPRVYKKLPGLEPLPNLKSDKPLLITGSFYIMQEVRALLGIKESSDPFNLQENWSKSYTVN